ncbi:MAG: hypothetical protein ABI585_00600 [Betaproteobacteria bacterium]
MAVATEVMSCRCSIAGMSSRRDDPPIPSRRILMRPRLLPVVAIALWSLVAFAQTAPAFPPGALETEARLLARVGPHAREWINQEAAREGAAGTISEEAARRAAAGYRDVAGRGGDIEALAFLVLMQAAKSAHEDLKVVMDDVKRINEAKASARQVAPRPGGVVAKPHAGVSTVSPTPRTPSPAAQATTSAKPLPRMEFDRKLTAARNDPGAMSEMGEMESLRLQMAMDRRSKLMSTLSNMLRKMSDTSKSVIQNLK